MTIVDRARELVRPRIHLTPPRGWMNDPNGILFDAKGRIHVFFQFEPDAPAWGRMRWGHAVSSDMLDWVHLPIALEPEAAGPDHLGCWSGSMVTPQNGPPMAFYTGISGTESDRVAVICAATGHDGFTTWVKEREPVIPSPPHDIRSDSFRDPFVWHDGRSWAMLVGAGSIDQEGLVLLYRSPDLRQWAYVGPLVTAHDVLGRDDLPAVDIDSPVWECPQLLRFGHLDLLVVSVVDRAPNVRPAHVVAFAGRMIGDRFVVRRAQRLGLGPDFYAPAATRLADGRYLMFGWIPEDPPDAGSARSWAGSMTLPRIVTLDPDGSASISLAAEIGRVPGRRQRFSDQRLDDGGTWSHIFDEPYVEWRTSLDPDSASSVRIDIEGPSGLEAELRYEPLERRLTISRMGRVSVAGRDPHGSAVLPPGRDDERIDLWIVIDGTVIELAANDVITAAVRRPDTPGGCRLTVTALGGAADLFDTETTQF